MEPDDSVAIVGIACRFPGADDIDEFWEVLKNGEDHVKIIPKERWDIENINIPRLDDNNWKPEATWAGLIKDHDKFDNKFFGISDSEAGWMDPQQCMALEVTYSALENAGFTREHLKETKTGVYVGVMNRDLSLGLNEAAAEFNNFLVTGFATSIISNLISYHFDIRGPSITVDTACSSALVSIHLGCQAIKSGDCEMAICGGVNSILSPINNILLSKARMITKIGKSQTFSADADGYVRGEGCGIVVLKKLKKARADGDRIWSIVMSGCNQDGKASTPITAPSAQQQKTLLQSIYSQHEISPSSIQFIEAHGTGTPLGDPTETNALAEFFGVHLEPKRKIPIGSVKTNIGHLESSAGTAGLIKVMLMMKYEKIVPSLHYSMDNSNTKIDFEKIPLEVSTQLSEWSRHDDGTRISCINSFGFGGTNCHAIVKQLAPIPKFTENTTNLTDFLVTLSATTQDALISTARHFQKKINTEIYDIRDLSYTSVKKREHFRYRIALVAKTTSDLKTQLSDAIDNFKLNVERETKKPQMIFLFCGVGTLWMEMCQKLLKTSKTFKNTAEEIDKELQKYLTISIVETLTNPPPNFITDSFIGPIAIFTCQIGLFKMWQSLGISPNVIIGQSVGEVAAAYAAGCLTLSEAVMVTYYRSLLSSKAPCGRMVVVGKCNVNKLKEVCKSYGETLNIAVYSSKETCVVSGNKLAIKSLKDKLSNNLEFPSVLLTDLNVTCAYHSQYMKEASEQLKYQMGDLKGRPPSTKIISTVSGKEIIGAEMGTAEYWSSNLIMPVLVVDAVSSAIDHDRNNIFLEIGPKPVIRAHLKMITDAEAESIPSCNSPDDVNTFGKAVAALHVRGIPINIEQMSPDKGHLTDIPRYKFYRTGTLLVSDTLRASLKCAKAIRDNHPFISIKPLSYQFSVVLSTENTPYMYEHVLDQTHIVPGALHGEIGLTVAKVLSNIPLSETSIFLNFLKPIFVGKRQTVELDVDVSKEVGSFTIKRKQDIVCQGKYFRAKTEYPVVTDIRRIKKMCPFHVSQQQFYDTLNGLGFEYGQNLTVIRNSWRADTEYIAELEVPSKIAEEMYKVNLHPCILDGVLQTLSISWISASKTRHDILNDIARPIPVKIGALSVKRTQQKMMYVYGKTISYTNDRALINLLLLSKKGEVIAEIENFEVKNISPRHLLSSVIDFSYKAIWVPVELDIYATETIHKSERSIFICLSEDFYSHCKNNFSSTCATFCLDLDFTSSFEKDKILEKLLKDIQSQNIKLNEVAEIIYVPGYDNSSEAPDSEEVYNCIKTSCLCLLKLIQRLFKDSIDIPIVVVTKNTQPHLGCSKQKYNITGSELWGMCRSIVRERTYSNLRLLDISDDTDLQMLPVIIGNIKASEIWKYTPEFKCYKNKLYINQIVRFNDDTLNFRNNHYSQNEALDLRSSSYENLEDLFFIPNQSFQVKYCSLKVETALVNPSLSPITTTLAIDDPDPWKTNRADGHGIIAAEICGTIDGEHLESQQQKISSLLKIQTVVPVTNYQKKELSFLTCFPCYASTIAHVPVSCLISKDEFPQYTPGNMLQSIWFFSLLEELNSGEPIGILYDKALPFNLELLQYILRSRRHETVFSCPIDEFRETYDVSGTYQLLLLTNNLSSIKDCCGKMAIIASRIITYSQLVSKADERIMRQKLPGIEICIINNDDMLSEHRLSKLITLLRSWLAKQPFIELTQNTMEGKNGILLNFNDRVRSEKMVNCEGFPVKTPKPYLFSKSAGYMIIGGLTGLGWETVELIAKMGGGCIAILSRQQPSEDRQKDINALSKKYDCKIIFLKTDVSTIDSLSKAFESYQKECQGFRLRGIFHGAAVVDDALFVYMTEEKFEKVLKPKIKGTLNLHSLTKDMKLDYFVLHSSITSVLGNAGQSNYGAGNAFMDTFAYYRRSLGFCGQTINWGALHLGILTASENVEKHLNSQGHHSLEPSEVMECLLHTLCSDLPQIVYGNFKWETIFRQSLDMIHLTSKLQPILQELNLLDVFTAKKNEKITVDLEELQTLPEERRKQKITNVLVLIAADIFAVEESLVRSETKFSLLGIDSMKAMALINTVYEHLSCKIPVMSILDDDANIESITTLIMHQMTLSSEVIGMIPVDKMMKLKTDNEQILINLNDVERDIYFFENDSNNFSFLLADIAINDSNINEPLIRKGIMDLFLLYPEIESLFSEKDGIPYRTVQKPQLKKQDDKVANYYFEALGMPNKDFPVSNFRDITVKDTCDKLSPSQIIIYDGRVVKVVCLKHKKIFSIRIFCDRILFDQTSTTKLALDFISLVEGNNLLPNTDTYGTIDELKDATNQAMDKGRAFWSRRVSLNIRNIILKQNPPIRKTQEKVKITHINLGRDLNNKLKIFFVKNNISRFEFFTTVFQIFLHLISGHDVISVCSFADLRRFLSTPNSTRSMENLIPYIAIFEDKEMTCSEFLQKNITDMREAMKYSIVPVNVIEKMFINKNVADNAFRFAIHTDQNSLVADPVGKTKIAMLTSVRFFDSRFHATLQISDGVNIDNGAMSLYFRKNIIDDTTADRVLECLLKISCTIVNKESSTIKHIQEHLNATSLELNSKNDDGKCELKEEIINTISLKKEKVKFRGVFLKETTDGKEHKVDLRFVETNDKKNILRWNTAKKEKTLEISSILNARSFFLNGMKGVMLQTDHRQHIFKTTDHEAFEVLITFINLES